MLDRLSSAVGTWGHALVERSYSAAPNTARVLRAVGQPMINMCAFLSGDFDWLHDTFAERHTDPLCSFWAADIYPKGYVQELVEREVSRAVAAAIAGKSVSAEETANQQRVALA